jgi:hypothetical protein
MHITAPRLTLKVQTGQISKLVAVLQMGFYLPVPAGSSVRAVLDAAGISRSYLEDKVKTVFLDGTAVDNLEAERIKNRSVIAVSGAMPGLVGAIFRKDSPISGLRSNVAKRPYDSSIQDGDELVLLKMFNIIAEEMGPELLRSGLTFAGKDMGNFFGNRRELLEKAILEVELDGNPIALQELFSTSFSNSEHIHLSACEQDLQ